MTTTRALGSLTFTLAFACGGITLTVDDDPGASGGATAGSSLGASGGKGGSSAAGSSHGGSSVAGTAGKPAGGTALLPCEIFEAEGIPCVAAHSTVRLLVPDYPGPLYQVQRGDATTLDIGSLGGVADIAAQDTFCAASTCVVTIIYDQSPHGHHLTVAPPGSAKPAPAVPAAIGDLPVTVNGRSAYGIRFRPGRGYRSACHECPYPTGPAATATGDEPQTIYMVTSAHDTVDGCCFDYGNAERSNNNDGNGTAEALYFGKGVIWGSGVGDGPWVMADLENGLYPGWENQQSNNISTNVPLPHDYVTAVVVGDTADKNGGKGRFALYGGNAQAGDLTILYDGIRPELPGYVPMMKQGSIVLSVAGDNSDGDGGRFYEGAMVNGAASKEVLDALQAALVAAGYGT